ncbi:AAA family ATPase [Candidatus Uhrbacteria bacterium]|nr:MAG: AAA family ATPase [Candidatus Uhrbacteria bacterium]
MFIKTVKIKNFRLFSAQTDFQIELNAPDGQNDGSGLTVFVGENGCGKSALLEAIALPIVSYKADSFDVQDFNDPTKEAEIKLLSREQFSVTGTMPKGEFNANGFLFKANVRSKATKAYLSSIVVSDQQYIKVDPAKPKDGSPDLRVSVNNPFKGRRFDENDVLILDKGRTSQTRLGAYNPTRFDRLMEDFDFQHIGDENSVPNVHEHLDATRDAAENAFLKQAITKFKEISGDELSLNLIDNWRPFSKGFLAVKKPNNQQVPLSMLGSGYEMIFSFLIAFYLSQQSGKQLICLIDEPELHLHPSLQEKFIEILLAFSKVAQVVLATHSPLLVKQLMTNKSVVVQILRKNSGTPQLVPISTATLPYFSSNEINYLAFNLATVEFHDELYGHIQEMQQKYLESDMIAYLNTKQQTNTKKWNQERGGQALGEKDVPLQIFIRNKIHHPENKSMQQSNFSPQELRTSIEAMIGIILNP